MMASQERDETRVWTLCKRMERLEKVLKQVSVLLSQLTHFSTLAKEKDMLFILNFPTLALITRTGTSKPIARLYSQMMRTQPKSANVPQHMLVQILEKIRWNTKRSTFGTTL